MHPGRLIDELIDPKLTLMRKICVASTNCFENSNDPVSKLISAPDPSRLLRVQLVPRMIRQSRKVHLLHCRMRDEVLRDLLRICLLRVVPNLQCLHSAQ